MSLPKFFICFALFLFSIIGVMAIFKKSGNKQEGKLNPLPIQVPIEVEIMDAPLYFESNPNLSSNKKSEVAIDNEPESHASLTLDEPPEAERIDEFFNINPPKLPIVETITYKSHVTWLKGRPAWLSDYAGHYKTSRHFIARSLNGKADYLKQDIAEGARFNILKPDKNIHFHLIIDTTRCKMWFYYHDLDTQQKVLVKTYSVGLGRVDPSKISGLLTPLGVYSLGSKIAVYKPKMMDIHNGTKTEMIQVFGTRWIPFDKEIQGTTESAKGFGIHGLPWVMKDGVLTEEFESLGKHGSDGCIRMPAKGIEELYSIVISRPTTVEIVKDFFDAENAIHLLTD